MSQEIRKVVLVTGGSSGIGRATAELFASKGYRVAFTGQRQERIQEVADICQNLSPYKEKNGAVAVKKTIEHFGRLDVLINNAGTLLATDVNDENSYETYRRMMVINNDAAMLAALAAVDELKKTGGNIVFVSGVAAKIGLNYFYGYSASKAALTMFARCLAIDVAPHVRVNVCSPGPVETRLGLGIGLENTEQFRHVFAKTTLRNRIAKPDEIASVIYFLASDEGRYINGHDLVVDDGFLIKPPTAPLEMDPIS